MYYNITNISLVLQSLFHATSLQKTHQSALQVQQKAEVGTLLVEILLSVKLCKKERTFQFSSHLFCIMKIEFSNINVFK